MIALACVLGAVAISRRRLPASQSSHFAEHATSKDQIWGEHSHLIKASRQRALSSLLQASSRRSAHPGADIARSHRRNNALGNSDSKGSYHSTFVKLLASTGTIVVSLCGYDQKDQLTGMVPYACQEAQGSVVIVNKTKGWIVTNRHVTMDKNVRSGIVNLMYVALHTNVEGSAGPKTQVYEVKEIDFLDDNDLALLNLTALVKFQNGTMQERIPIHPGEHANLGLSAIEFAEETSVGDVVLAMGNNFGFADSMTMGMVSAIREDSAVSAAAPGGEGGEGGATDKGPGMGTSALFKSGAESGLERLRTAMKGQKSSLTESLTDAVAEVPAQKAMRHLFLPTPKMKKLTEKESEAQFKSKLASILGTKTGLEEGESAMQTSSEKRVSPTGGNMHVGSGKQKTTVEENECGTPGLRTVRVLQHDAGINVGNSGGALVDTTGKLVGINTKQITSGSAPGNDGVAFAIPALDVVCLVQQWTDYTECLDLHDKVDCKETSMQGTDPYGGGMECAGGYYDSNGEVIAKCERFMPQSSGGFDISQIFGGALSGSARAAK